MSTQSRPYQENAVNGVFAEWDQVRAVCLVAATGAGKTVMAEMIARRVISTGKRIVFFAHRTELIDQAHDRFERAFPGQVGKVQASSEVHPEKPIQVASIQTCLKREHWPASDFVTLDECFPAGTLVDGKPIETLAPGDVVWCVDHATGRRTTARVTRVFEKTASSLVTVSAGGNEVTSTGNHPFFVRGEGYVQAKDLVPGDMLAVREDVQRGANVERERTGDLLEGVQVRDLRGSHGGYQPSPRKRSDEGTEPDASRTCAAEAIGHAESDGPCAQCTRGERDRPDEASGGAANASGPVVGSGIRGVHQQATDERLPSGVQAGPRPSRSKDRRGAGGEKPRSSVKKGAGQEERRSLVWVRVDSVAHSELGSPVRVYNLEVEGAHTYFANGYLVHNCHHYESEQWQEVDGHYSDAKVVGLTATPARQDGRALDTYQALVVAAHYSELLKDGYLAQCKAYQPPQILKNGIAQQPLKAWQLYNPRQLTTFAFGRSVKYCAQQVEVFKNAGISSAQISYKTPTNERRYIIDCAREGKIKVLWSDTALTEGVDIARAKCALLARGFQHATPYLQAGGRVLRPWEGEQAIIIDLCGSTLIHGLPTEDRAYSLDGKHGIQRTTIAPLKNCPKCGATILSAYQDCPECGFHFATKEQRAPKIWDLELREVYLGDATAPEKKHGEWLRLLALSSERGWGVSFALKEYHKLFADAPDMSVISWERRLEEFKQLRAFGKARGFKDGWAAVRYKQMFGSWPPKAWSSAA